MSSFRERGHTPFEQLPASELERILIENSKALKDLGVTSPLANIMYQSRLGAEKHLEGYELVLDSSGRPAITAHNIDRTIGIGQPQFRGSLTPDREDTYIKTTADIATVTNRLNDIARNSGDQEYELPKELLNP